MSVLKKRELFQFLLCFYEVNVSRIFTDGKPLTESQRQRLCRMLYKSLLEMRILGWQGEAEQAADLADAFHNLPSMLWDEDFSLNYLRNFLMSYQQKYPKVVVCNYLMMLDDIDKEEFNW